MRAFLQARFWPLPVLSSTYLLSEPASLLRPHPLRRLRYGGLGGLGSVPCFYLGGFNHFLTSDSSADCEAALEVLPSGRAIIILTYSFTSG